MLKKRLIAVLIIRNGQVVQSVRFRHTNVIHYDAIHAVEAFNKWAVDEIVLLDVSREPTSRDKFVETVEKVSRHCFVPLAVGGWITSLEYGQQLLRSGADKLVVNTALARSPDLVTQLSRRYGRQCIIASMDISRTNGGAQIMVDRGREATGVNPVEWARGAQQLGAGEILFNSIEFDGARKGYDLVCLKEVCEAVTCPVIAFGGVFTWQHLVEGFEAGASAAAAANIFHYTEQATRKAKTYLAQAQIPVRYEGRLPEPRAT